MTSFAARLADAIGQRYTFHPEIGRTLGGGEETVAYEAHAGEHHLVIRVSPPWRTLAELTWAFELASWAAARIPEAVAPARARGREPAFELDGRVVSVFPFVAGDPLDRTDDEERDEAARLLARLHRVLPAYPGAMRRPPTSAAAPERQPRVALQGFDDRELDATIADLSARATRALTHGDYYRGNLRCIDRRVVGLLDWDDATMWFLEYELAWSVWEFAQADEAAELDVGRARRFLAAYAGDGPVSVRDVGFVVPIIRAELREEVRDARAAEEQGRRVDAEYTARAAEAFWRLRDQRL